jgi:2-keto-4-pentenoate hydratase/2-oxohepta-3-ene-1,7-dioic acid hydratase in catechol pathway
MKLVRYGLPGQERPGLLDKQGKVRNLSGYVDDIASDSLGSGVLEKLSDLQHSSLEEVDGSPRLGVPVGKIGKIVCVGLNYRDHAEESGMEIPNEPVIFMKATTSLSGPYDPIEAPPGFKKLDWEVELGIIIGKTARYVSEEKAEESIVGYCVAHDVSERYFQLERDGQWLKGKSCDTFCPLGPWLVTKDEVDDPHSLAIWTEINGKRYQNSNTSQFIFRIPMLISYISQFMTLLPGDIVLTGTPPGVGMGQSPNVWLKPGDEVRMGIDGLGEQRQEVKIANSKPSQTY